MIQMVFFVQALAVRHLGLWIGRNLLAGRRWLLQVSGNLPNKTD
jgi:hypothetical protein